MLDNKRALYGMKFVDKGLLITIYGGGNHNSTLEDGFFLKFLSRQKYFSVYRFRTSAHHLGRYSPLVSAYCSAPLIRLSSTIQSFSRLQVLSRGCFTVFCI